MEPPKAKRNHVAAAFFQVLEALEWDVECVTRFGPGRFRSDEVSESIPGTIDDFVTAGAAIAGFRKGSRWLELGLGYPSRPCVALGSDCTFLSGIQPLEEFRSMLTKLNLPEETRLLGDLEGVVNEVSSTLRGLTGINKGYALYWIDQLSPGEWDALCVAYPEFAHRLLRRLGHTYVALSWDDPYDAASRTRLKAIVRKAVWQRTRSRLAPWRRHRTG